jgi:predicted HAD superfamily Cof-like phosphohydrolase
MSRVWYWDIEDMHETFGVHDWVAKTVEQQDKKKLKKYLEFRIKFLQEELNETKKALKEGDPEEIVDGLIDLCVVAIGTLDAFGVDRKEAWNEVHKANMKKKVGVKESRPNPLGLPDLIKPEGWTAPSHKDNHGLLDYVFDK